MTAKHFRAPRLFHKTLDLIALSIGKFLYGDIWWARIRLIFLIGMADLTAIVLVFMFEGTSVNRIWHNIIFPSLILFIGFVVVAGIVRDSLESKSKIVISLLGFITVIGFLIWAEIQFTKRIGLTGQPIWQYLLAPLGWFFAILLAARYIQDIYELENYSLGLLYIVSSFLGLAYPKLVIANNGYQIESDKVNRLDRIGGPGYLIIKPGNVVLVQELNVSSKVYSAKKVFMTRFGSILSIADLNDQRLSVECASAFTKDGIKVNVKNIEMRFRLWAPPLNGNAGKININPYPYTAQAVKDSFYNRSVSDEGISLWSDMVKKIVTGRITDYISGEQFDQIVTPTFQQREPRDEIRRQLFSAETQKKFKDIGAQLLWCDIGHFEEDRAALAQRLETWSAKWEGNANVIRARGEAQRIAYQEIGHAEAQADLLTSIIHAFDDIDLSSEKKDQHIRNVILIRTAQVLEALMDTKKSLPAETEKKRPAKSANEGVKKEEQQS